MTQGKPHTMSYQTRHIRLKWPEWCSLSWQPLISRSLQINHIISYYYEAQDVYKVTNEHAVICKQRQPHLWRTEVPRSWCSSVLLWGCLGDVVSRGGSQQGGVHGFMCVFLLKMFLKNYVNCIQVNYCPTYSIFLSTVDMSRVIDSVSGLIYKGH